MGINNIPRTQWNDEWEFNEEMKPVRGGVRKGHRREIDEHRNIARWIGQEENEVKVLSKHRAIKGTNSERKEIRN